MSNKPFDLEKALAGEPVVLRNGNKAFVLASIPDNEEASFPLLGYACNKDGNYCSTEQWADNGMVTVYDEEHSFDIIGMWEEPRPRVKLDLPTPLETVQKGQEVYYLELGNQFSQISKFNFNEDNPCAFQLYKNGGLFATESDAQEWLDAMREARR